MITSPTKRTILLVSLPAMAIIAGFLTYRQLAPQDLHYHAGFKIFHNGQTQDFSDSRYMTVEPCVLDKSKVETVGEVHLHDGVGTVIHVHHAVQTWGDLFRYLAIPEAEQATLSAYVNGIRIPGNIGTLTIKPYDSAVILINTPGRPQPYLQTAVTRTEINTAEQKSETCG